MSLQNKAFNAPLFIIVSVLAFGTGLVIVTASQKTTENRSKASSGPYYCDTACSPAAGGIGGSACLACMGSLPKDGQTCNTDYTTKASNDCENCPGAKFHADPATGQPRCGSLVVVPTPTDDPWGDCVTRIEATGECVQNYWQFVEERENDWRCKPVFAYLNLCSPAVELPTEPRPEQDPGINPGQE